VVPESFVTALGDDVEIGHAPGSECVEAIFVSTLDLRKLPRRRRLQVG